MVKHLRLKISTRKMDFCNSSSYTWSTRDLLGQGATGNVYKSRKKSNGDPYAVKVFNNVGMMRPPEVRMREFEVLKKLDHENIVKLFAIEEEFKTRSHVIIMELCSGGSLYTMLEHPQNAYGLCERDLKHVIHDVVAGMKHLREQGIVHRDLKPGNIMKFILEDGSCTYKLTDFGAARELEPSEHFMSIYGTEEYLHPDLYERGVMKNRNNKKFFASVDLWSIGITLYHIATGDLPFRPYGGRENKETMHHMITQKEKGVISGVQTIEKGPIEWSKKLPDHIQISEGLKDLLTPVIAGCLEAERVNMITFEEFFSQIQDILSRKVISLYSVHSCAFHVIYSKLDDCLANFQEQIAVQTGISASVQRLFFKYQSFKPEPMDQVSKYPQTSMDEPLIMFGGDHIFSSEHLYKKKIPVVPKMSDVFDLDNDAALSKLIVNTAYCSKFAVCEYEASLKAIYIARESFSFNLERKMFEMCNDCQQMESKWLLTNTKYQNYHESQVGELKILDVLLSTTPPSKDISDIRQDLCSWSDMKKGSIEGLNDQFVSLVEKLKTKLSDVLEEKRLTQEWKLCIDKPLHEPELFHEKISAYTSVIEDIANRFRKEKFQRRLGLIDEQDHMHDRTRLNSLLSKIEELVSKCLVKRNKSHIALGEWLSIVNGHYMQTDKLSRHVQDIVEQYEGVGVDLWNQERTKKTTDLLEKISSQKQSNGKTDEERKTTILDNQMNEVSRVTKESVNTAYENSQQLKKLAALLIEAYDSTSLTEDLQGFQLSDGSSIEDGT